MKERQARQEDELEDIEIIPLLFPETERRHLVNLARGNAEHYRGSSALKGELRRLASIGLIRRLPGHRIHGVDEKAEFNLAEYVELTDLGRRWVKKSRQIEQSDLPE